MKVLPHLYLDSCELEPGGEWPGSSPSWRIVRISAGAAYWISPSEVVDLAKGLVLVLGPTAQGVLRSSLIGSVTLHFFNFSPEHLVGLMSLSERLSLDSFAQFVQTRTYAADSDLARQYAELVEKPSKRRSFFYRCRILNLVALVFGDELPQTHQPKTNVATSLLRFEEIISKLTDADLIHCSSGQLAEMCGCSLRHFRRMFRAQFRTSIRAKQTELRLEKARQLLMETDDKMSTIARATGYHHLGFFNLMFKKRFGMTPGEWRRRHPSPSVSSSADALQVS